MLNLNEDYLCMDEIHHRLGDSWEPGDSLRYYHKDSNKYRLFQDEFSLYVALQNHVQQIPNSFEGGRAAMELYANGSELLL